MGVSELKAAVGPLQRRVKRLDTPWGVLYLRTLSAAEYVYFCDKTDIPTLVALAMCDEDGDPTDSWFDPKVGVKDESVKWLSGPDCPAELMQILVREAMAHCFPDGFDLVGVAEKNSPSTQSDGS